MWERDLLRDYNLAKALKIMVGTPYLDKDLMETTMMVPGKFKISQDHKKLILREVAQKLRLAKEFCWRKKQAAQYGSNSDKMLNKLTKINGFSTKEKYFSHLR